MKRKGFTLIELLAVIVVLAIIALIALPIITNVIDKAKKGALKNSAYGLLEASELYLAKNMDKTLETMEFTCSNNLCVSGTEKIDYKGSIDLGKIKIYSDKKVAICLENDKNSAIKLANEKEVTIETGNCNYTGETYEVDEFVSLDKYNEIKNTLETVQTSSDELADELTELKSKGTATSSEILNNKTAVVQGEEITGTIANNGLLNKTLNAGESYTIPIGYTSGGTITSKTLTSQTVSTATSNNIFNGYTAFVNGAKITGTYELTNTQTTTLYSGTRVASLSRTITLNKGVYYILVYNLFSGSNVPTAAFTGNTVITSSNAADTISSIIANKFFKVNVNNDNTTINLILYGGIATTSFLHDITIYILK